MTTRDRVLALLVVTFWGLNFVVVDWGMRGIPPLLFLLLRFLVVPLACLVVPRPSVRWRDLALVGLLTSVGQFGLLYTALAVGMPPGLASLVLQAQAAFTVVFAVAVLRESPRIRQVVGVGLGLLGLLVIGLGRGGAVTLAGLALTIAAAAFWAGGNIAARRLQGASGLGITVWSALFVPGPVLALALIVEGPARIAQAITQLTPVSALSTLYTAALASWFGYGVWNSLLGRYRAGEVAPYSLLVPVVGITAAFLLLGERPTPWGIAGGLLLVAGVAASTWSGPIRRPAGWSRGSQGARGGP